MTGFASLIDQQNSIRILTTILQKRTIPHALLFTGIDGVGKQAAAQTFAMALNCANPRCNSDHQLDNSNRPAEQGKNDGATVEPCGTCNACRKIASNQHPDYIHIKPDGPMIRISQIRELLRTLAMRPYEANFRTIVISDAHCMNPEAGNALLKALEEPPHNTILILTANGISDLLPTVVSRCHHIRFNPLSVESLASTLMETFRIGENRAFALSGLSSGGLKMANQLQKEKWIEKRDWILEQSGFFGGTNTTDRPGAFFALAQHLSQKKEEALMALFLLKILYRDLLVCRFQPDQVINSDIKQVIVEIAGGESETDLLEKIDAIDTAEKNIEGNANSRLTLEALFLTLAKKSEIH